jgi:predicted permease
VRSGDKLVLRLRSLLRRPEVERELDEELRFHLEQQIEENLAAGMTLEEARYAARRAIGGLAQIKEQCRDTRGVDYIENFFQDLRYGLRMMVKDPGFFAVALLTLALGIGANTAIFSLLDSVLLKTLPVAHPEQVVSLSHFSPTGDGESFTYPQFEQFRKAGELFSGVFGFAYRSAKVNFGGRREEVIAQLASGEYFRGLGIPTAVGRPLRPEDDQGANRQPVAVISHRLWQLRFARDPSIVGKILNVNGVPLTVVGVMPAGFFGTSLDYATDIWVPISLEPRIDGGSSSLASTGNHWVMVMARLKPGVSVRQAAAGTNVMMQRYLRSINARPEELQQRIEVAAGGRPVSGIRQNVSGPLLILMTIVGLVLLLACTNIANLLLAKAAARQREITVRLAMGAGRLRLVRQLITESLLLAALGGMAGLAVAQLGNSALLDFIAYAMNLTVPVQFQLHLDVRLLAFTTAISLMSGILFGLAPALRATRPDLTSGLKEGAAGGSLHRLRMNKVLLISQVAICLPLLFVACLFIRSFQNLARVDLGFVPTNVVQIKSIVFDPAYTPARLNNTSDRLLEEIKATPGVVSASMSQPGVFSHSTSQTDVIVDGEPKLVHTLNVTPGFFRTLQIPLLRGREFTPTDSAKVPQVCVISETLARRFLHSDNPVGERLLTGFGPNKLEVVGIAKDTKYDSVLAEPSPVIYAPLAPDFIPNFRVFEIRGTFDAGASVATVVQIARRVDPDLPMDIRPLNEFIGESLAVQHLTARVTGFFGVLGLLLVCLGLHGLMSYVVTQRTREVGIRVALGAERFDVVRLLMMEAMVLVLIGSGVGFIVSVLSVAASRLVGGELFGLNATDPVSLLVAAALLVGVGLFASYLPAKRATKIEPMVALRYE